MGGENGGPNVPQGVPLSSCWCGETAATYRLHLDDAMTGGSIGVEDPFVVAISRFRETCARRSPSGPPNCVSGALFPMSGIPGRAGRCRSRERQRGHADQIGSGIRIRHPAPVAFVDILDSRITRPPCRAAQRRLAVLGRMGHVVGAVSMCVADSFPNMLTACSPITQQFRCPPWVPSKGPGTPYVYAREWKGFVWCGRKVPMGTQYY
jgi:hypothetical protein